VPLRVAPWNLGDENTAGQPPNITTHVGVRAPVIPRSLGVDMTARIRLALSSYIPLFVVGIIRFDDFRLRIVLSGIVLSGIVSLVSLIRVSVKRVQPRKATPTFVRDLSSEVAGYVATYLLPFMTVDQPGPRDLLAYAFVLVTLGIVFVNSDLVGVNPILSLCGYRVLQVSGVRKLATGEDADTIVISRCPVVAGSGATLADLATGVSLVIPPNGSDDL